MFNLRSFVGKIYTRKVVHAIHRTLFTEESIGLVGFSHWCEQRKKNSGLSENEVLTRIDSVLSSGRFILTDDFKNIVAYAPANYELMNKLCKCYHEQTQLTKISYFNFGPFVMRMYHKAKQPDFAFKAITDEDLIPFFEHLKSYQICMDLLYESGRYKQVVEIWEHFQNRSKIAEKMKFPRSLSVLVFGALYKMKSIEAKEFGLKLYSSFRNETEKNLPRRALMFLVGLCLRVNDYEIAYELLSTTNCDDFIIGRTMKIILCAKLNRIPEIFRLFQKTIESDLPMTSFEDSEMSYDILNPVEQATNSKDSQTKERCERYFKLLRSGRHIVNVSLDVLLTSPVILTPSSSDALQEWSTPKEQLNLLPDTFVTDRSVLTYKDELEAMEDLEKFKKAERLQKRREKILETVAQKIIKDGPFEA